MDNTTLIRLEHVSRYYGGHLALDKVSFEVQKGEVLGLLGPNGAGKSTTLQIMSGNLAPSAGRIWVDGVDLLDEPKRAKGALGYLPDQPPLYRELTVDEYLAYCARLNRIPAGQRHTAVQRAKKRCGLAAVGPRLIGNLSKGYRQRVGIAQAIIHSPPVVILDEPTVGLDPLQMREIRALIRELSDQHSVILSSHVLPEVQAVCDRVQIISRGRLVLSDSIAGLEQRLRGTSLIAAFRQPPAAETLADLPGVTEVETLGEGRFRLRFAADHSPAEAVVEQAVAGGWRLYELSPERLSLEQVFVDITRDDPGAAVREEAA
ncbi:MAG TPA: ATP-binding cassette domain-containing protein [Gammaproteobacteria bacterium]|nr:ATP-binding cassette domain-containing protein [Gammaproteobacteria bacterium]